jgi:colanic acid biosynthesis glycosyl transferase WcaI
VLILLMNQFFWPDEAATSQLLTDLAREMSSRGHDVHVIAATGSYGASSVDSAPPVTIHRVPALPFSRGKLARVLSYLSFYVRAGWTTLRVPKPDLIITLTTPPLLSLLGTLAKFVRGSRHWIWEMDVYPDVAVSLGHFEAGGLPERLVGMLADFSRRRADGILALGECMKALLVRRGIAPEKIVVAENWADGAAITPVPAPRTQNGKLTVLYSGNLGLAHEIATIGAAMVELGHRDEFAFVFTGGGGRRKELKEQCERSGVQNASFHPYVARSVLGESLGAGDIGLVTQQASCCGAVVPSKVYGLLAAARPLLFIGPAEATPARIIRAHGCGWHLCCGDSAGLVNLLEHLAVHPEEISEAGSRGRTAFLEHYDLPLGVARICALLQVERLSTRPAASAADQAPTDKHPHLQTQTDATHLA